ncbi:hypothetical protein EB810_07245 [Altererythrobacter sp. FM1]|nr:hypothetical protein EB810_07245 [Altererythrobacter sp. FM1]
MPDPALVDDAAGAGYGLPRRLRLLAMTREEDGRVIRCSRLRYSGSAPPEMIILSYSYSE